MSKVNPPVPEFAEGAFRTTLFFSFFGRIVSLLGLRRKLPPVSVLRRVFRSPAPPPKASCGIELTVSVSTVMFLTDPSAGAVLPFVNGNCVNDLFDCTVGGLAELGAVAGFRVSFLPSALLDPACLLPALSFPLSGLEFPSFPNASSIGFSSIRSGWSFEPPLLVRAVLVPIAGVAGRLLSCTVSRGGPLPLIPRTGVRIPDFTGWSSSGISDSLPNVELRLGRSTTMLGVVGVDCDWSILRVVKKGPFDPEDADGGGDLTRGPEC